MSRDRDDNPFDDLFEQINEMMNRMMDEDFEMNVSGYSYSNAPGEEPEFNTFGGQPGDLGGTGFQGGETTHYDIIDEDDSLRAIIDLPGVEKDDIDLSLSSKKMKIEAKKPEMERSYDETISLPVEVDSDTADARFNNGVLEVTVDKDDSTSTKDIQIE
ncbi:MAG: Hsp20/alpha crystallin family protein [Halobacteria archaeon]